MSKFMWTRIAKGEEVQRSREYHYSNFHNYARNDCSRARRRVGTTFFLRIRTSYVWKRANTFSTLLLHTITNAESKAAHTCPARRSAATTSRVQWMSDVNSWKNKCMVVRGVQTVDTVFVSPVVINRANSDFGLLAKFRKPTKPRLFGDCKINNGYCTNKTFNGDGVFRAPRSERGTRRFLRHDIYDEPSVDWLATIGVPHSQAAPVTKFTGYLTRSKKIQWNFQRFSGYLVVFFFIVFTVLLLLYYYLIFYRTRVLQRLFFFFKNIVFYTRARQRDCADYTPSLPSPLVLDSPWVHDFIRSFKRGGRLSSIPRCTYVQQGLGFVAGRRTNVPYSVSLSYVGRILCRHRTIRSLTGDGRRTPVCRYDGMANRRGFPPKFLEHVVLSTVFTAVHIDVYLVRVGAVYGSTVTLCMRRVAFYPLAMW